jgi:hypothetical protein
MACPGLSIAEVAEGEREKSTEADEQGLDVLPSAGVLHGI